MSMPGDGGRDTRIDSTTLQTDGGRPSEAKVDTSDNATNDTRRPSQLSGASATFFPGAPIHLRPPIAFTPNVDDPISPGTTSPIQAPPEEAVAALQGVVQSSNSATPEEVQSQSIPILDVSDHSTTPSVRASPRQAMAALQQGVAVRDFADPQEIQSQSRPILDVSDPSTPSTDSGASIVRFPRPARFILPSSNGSSQPSSAVPGTPARLQYASDQLQVRDQSFFRREIARRLAIQSGEIDLPTASVTPNEPSQISPYMAAVYQMSDATPPPLILDGRIPEQRRRHRLPDKSEFNPVGANHAPRYVEPMRGRSTAERPVNANMPLVVRPTPAFISGETTVPVEPPPTAERERRRDEHVRLVDHGLSSGEGSEHAIASDDEDELSESSSEPENPLQGIVRGRPRNAAWGEHPVAPDEENVPDESSSEGENP